MTEIRIEKIPGFQIGHEENFAAGTGCTVILCEGGAVAGVDVRGGSPGTRETDALNPVNNRKEIHAVLLAGGSAFGLDAAGGVMRYLEERGVGRSVGVTRVPNVCAAILFDLKCGDSKIRPDAEMGYRACRNAGAGPLLQGCVGAGTGCTVGKVKGHEFAMKGGIGLCALREGELMVGAVAAVNCVGDVFDNKLGRAVAGVLSRDKKSIADTEELILAGYAKETDFFSGNTVLGCVITNAKLSKAEANKLASVGQNGLARAIRPAHSVFDGDTLFTMCTGEVAATPDAVGILAVRAVERAILSAVKRAEPLFGYPAYRNLFPQG